MQSELSTQAPEAESVAPGTPHPYHGLRSLPTDPDTLIRASEVPGYIGIAKQTMSRWRCEGRPPRYVRLGRRVFYRAGDLRSWVRSQIRDNTIASMDDG